jgi:S-(hydroxymethyl)glutathione dehydrogenase / alcohol dehydrogenase
VTYARVLERVGSPLASVSLDLPAPGPGAVRVALRASGVCHSDLHALLGEWSVPLPIVLGHEGAGVATAVGSGVRDVCVGLRTVLVS